MYTYRLESMDESQRVIDRSMSSNSAIEMIPIIVDICKQEFTMKKPVALSMGEGVWRIFDLENPSIYAQVSIIKDAN